MGVLDRASRTSRDVRVPISIPFVPFLLAGFAVALGKKLKWWPFRIAVPATLALGLVWSFLAAPAQWEQHLGIRGYARDNLAGIARWCNEHLEPDAKLLVHDAGYIAYSTKFRLTDLVGLKTPWVVPYHRALTFPTNGASRADAIHLIALRARPSYLVVLSTWELEYRIAGGLAQRGWTVGRMTQPGQFAFDVYRLLPPSPVANDEAP